MISDIKRNTIQRKLVLDAVRELGCHASAEEIYAKVLLIYPNISKGTVYRNLKLLSDAGEIIKLSNIDSIDRYDHNCHKHYHFICDNCNKVFDVEMDYLDNLMDNVKIQSGFLYTGHTLSFKGICSECIKKIN